MSATNEELRLLKQQVNGIAETQNEMKDVMKDVAESLKALTRLEVQHAETRSALNRSFKLIGTLEDRLREVEISMPNLKLASGWVFKAMVGLIAVLSAVSFANLLM